jgi:membrane protein YdbS with pleckstrin-like domain
MTEPGGICDNCERKIGRLEQAYPWQGHTVCSECHERLSRAAAKDAGPAPAAKDAGPAPAAAGSAAPAAEAEDSTQWQGSPAVVRYLPLYALLGVLSLAAVAAAVYLHWAVLLVLPLLLLALVVEEVQRRSIRYTITTRRVVAEQGIISRNRHEVRIGIIQEVTCHQTVAGRIFGYGSVGVDTAASDEVEIRMTNIPDPSGVVQLLNSLRG